jgi:hypothetical protein
MNNKSDGLDDDVIPTCTRAGCALGQPRLLILVPALRNAADSTRTRQAAYEACKIRNPLIDARDVSIPSHET